MKPRSLKEEWLKSETHRFIAEKMLVLENGFEIDDIVITAFDSDAFGVHVVFSLDDEVCFITVLKNAVVSDIVGDIFKDRVYDLKILNHKEFLEVFLFCKYPETISTIKRRELTMGPVRGKRITI